MANRSNKCFPSFVPLDSEFSPGLRVIDNFSDRISFNVHDKEKDDKSHVLQLDTMVLEFFSSPSIAIIVMGCWNTNNFYFYFLLFFWFYIDFLFLFFLFWTMKKACDTTVTWHVTWCNIIGLEHSKRIWKMISEHIYTTWQPWVRNKADIRM